MEQTHNSDTKFYKHPIFAVASALIVLLSLKFGFNPFSLFNEMLGDLIENPIIIGLIVWYVIKRDIAELIQKGKSVNNEAADC